jgi:hypothetical protein
MRSKRSRGSNRSKEGKRREILKSNLIKLKANIK